MIPYLVDILGCIRVKFKLEKLILYTFKFDLEDVHIMLK